MALRIIKNTNIKNKRVLVRADFNVPLDDKGSITDDSRIKAAIPTIDYLLKHNARIVLMSHLGRPEGKIVETLRLTPIAKRLSKLLKKKVVKTNDCIGDEVKTAVANMKPKDVILLENLRFYKEEEQNDVEFAKQLANLGEVYIDDAFGCAHRSHASVDAVTKFLPSCAGFLMEKEVKNLSVLTKNPKKPFVVIMGGAKVSDKINVINNLVKLSDSILIGGAMMFTFYKSQGISIGKSKCEADKLDIASNILKNSKNKIILPTDVIVADKIEAGVKTRIVSVKNIKEHDIGLDLGPETVAVYKEIIKNAKTVFWNGPLGYAELPEFSAASNETAKFLASQKNKIVIVGGGDTVAVIQKLKLEKKFTHVSTGGGASLEFLEGKVLPGIKVLEEA